MKKFLVYIILLIFMYILGFIKINTNKYDFKFMDKNYTRIIKGIAILLVVTVHVAAYWCGVGGLQFIGGIGVALFLICSGYGLYCSYEKSGLKNYFKKKIMKIWLPFLLVEIVSILMWKDISFNEIILDISLIKPISPFAWYMNYLMICYLLFYIIIKIKDNKQLSQKGTLNLFLFIFLIWFIIESTILVNSEIPMLKSRQMLSFVFGVYLAQNKNKEISTKLASISILLGLAMMLITQISFVKSLPFILYNILYLGTVFPLAIGVLSIINRYKILFKNKLLVHVSMISYEIYFIHQYSINILNIMKGYEGIIIFGIVTILFAYLLHLVSGFINKCLIKKRGEIW